APKTARMANGVFVKLEIKLRARGRRAGIRPTLRTAAQRGVEDSSHPVWGANLDPFSFQAYAKDACPWLLSQHASGVPNVHFSGVEGCLEDEFILRLPNAGSACSDCRSGCGRRPLRRRDCDSYRRSAANDQNPFQLTAFLECLTRRLSLVRLLRGC